MKMRRNLRKPGKITILYEEQRGGKVIDLRGKGRAEDATRGNLGISWAWEGCIHPGAWRPASCAHWYFPSGSPLEVQAIPCDPTVRQVTGLKKWLENFLRIRFIRNLWLNDACQMNMDFGICQRGSIWVETIRIKVLEFMWSLQFHIYS